MDKVTGVIESREVKDVVGRGGKVNQLIALSVNGTRYSTFDNLVPADVADRLGALKTGDEVELTYKENPGKGRDGSPVTYLNIVDAVRVDRVGGSPTAPPAVQSTGQGKTKAPAKGEPLIDKIVGTCTQYAVLYVNQKMATTGAVVPIDEVKEVAEALSRFQYELIMTWGE